MKSLLLLPLTLVLGVLALVVLPVLQLPACCPGQERIQGARLLALQQQVPCDLLCWHWQTPLLLQETLFLMSLLLHAADASSAPYSSQRGWSEWLLMPSACLQHDRTRQ